MPTDKGILRHGWSLAFNQSPNQYINSKSWLASLFFLTPLSYGVMELFFFYSFNVKKVRVPTAPQWQAFTSVCSYSNGRSTEANYKSKVGGMAQ
jgi:hypothetical protein